MNILECLTGIEFCLISEWLSLVFPRCRSASQIKSHSIFYFVIFEYFPYARTLTGTDMSYFRLQSDYHGVPQSQR